MTKLSILVGNTNYDNMHTLSCCEADVVAMEEVLTASKKYDYSLKLINENAENLKNKIRNFIGKHDKISEIFFYFTGHGEQNDQDFFHCATNFSETEPNLTGLADSDLDQILRSAEANAIIKVVDACNSGVRAIKSTSQIFINNDQKAGFSNYFRITSCLENQSSFTGDPLSVFTSRFIDATLQKTEGPLHYTEIIAYLRDAFAKEVEQIPFFVAQGDDRTVFCEDTSNFKKLAEKYLANTASESIIDDNNIEPSEVAPEGLSIIQQLQIKEEGYAQPDTAQKSIDALVDSITQQLESDQSYQDFYDMKIDLSDSYDNVSMEAFIIRVLEKQDRPDNLVYAKHSKDYKKRNRGLLGSLASIPGLYGYDDEEFVEQYDLELNCSIQKAQTTFTFTPKFRSLEQIKLTVSVAPSLPTCYIFERWSAHQLSSWEHYDNEGKQLTRHWYKLEWNSDSETDSIAESIAKDISNFVDKQIAKALPKNEE